MFKKLLQSIKHFIYRLRSLWIDFKRFGWGLGREGDKQLIASFAGSSKKLPVYLKRRFKNKNLSSRRARIFTV